MVLRLKIFLILALISGTASAAEHHPHHGKDIEPYVFTHGKPVRSIVDSHPNGSARSCPHEKDILKWLPSDYSLKDEDGHYHLVLASSDHQLPILINWIAISFVLGYLPSHRLLIHFHCDGPATRRFVEKHLLQVCMPPPKRKAKKKGENQWRRIIQDRLGSTLELVKAMDNTDFGTLTFDLDAPWIRNMIAVFDHFGQNQGQNGNFDFIAMGTIMEKKYDGQVITNFGAVYFKNSPASKALAEKAWWSLNSDWDAPYPDQDYVTAALFDKTNITQYPIPELAAISEDHTKDELCVKFPKTCTWLATGVQGEYNIQSQSPSPPSSIQGKYMFLPQVVAPRDCKRICSGATTLLQHCGIAYCLPELMQVSRNTKTTDNLKCNEIPEYILKDGDIVKMVNAEIPSHGFQPAAHGVFDSRTQQHMIKVIENFIGPNRVLGFCRAYPKVCSPSNRGDQFNITVHTTTSTSDVKRRHRRRSLFRDN
eukprot:gene5350-10697_t